ncbi:MerR family transcriptional regulator [Herminiimonas sp. KBW02]|uniref:chaperone modulator CbpM n=1 Tax=Herminiimonas sp. KBW02 TaxID=2153363 RepID=UPI000F5AD0EC|nr:chaperone modulator CbpM [Herminiimonas sp. KBW02]RQO38475.1 MerR family transcriptional regulator [Herminiimonas sp. KBW02]
MNQTTSVYCASQLLDDDVTLTLIELSQACNAPQELITAWVVEGVLEPAGQRPQEWRFSGTALRRARVAQHLTQDLEVNTPGVALALDLLERIDALEAQLKRRSR